MHKHICSGKSPKSPNIEKKKRKEEKAVSTALVLCRIKYEISPQVPRAQSTMRYIHGPLYNRDSDVTERYLWSFSKIYFCKNDSFSRAFHEIWTEASCIGKGEAKCSIAVAKQLLVANSKTVQERQSR